MELVVVLLLLAGFLIFFKLLALVFKAGLMVLSVPFQIAGAILGVILALLFIPFAVLAGVFTAIFAPLLILGPFLPIILVLLGFYLILKK